MKTEKFGALSFARLRVVGPYGLNYEPACKKLYAWQQSMGLDDAPWYFFYMDNPETTAPENCRTDICVPVADDFVVEGDPEIERAEFEGGLFVTERHEIKGMDDYSPLWKSFASAVMTAGHVPDARPCFELYHKYDEVTGEADVTLAFAVKS